MRVRIRPLIASTFHSDGGTMFGLVPKPIWHKRLPADERNRIPQYARVLLIELPDGRRGLLDTGCGPASQFGDKERELNGLGAGWPLSDALAAAGLAPADLDWIAFTHLHWDHAGSLVAPATDTVFSRATFHVHTAEWEDARSGNELLYKSYPPPIQQALAEVPAHRLRLVTDAAPTVAPGISLVRSGGHTRGHCTLVVEEPTVWIQGAWRDFPLAVFAGDVCPTQHHLRMVFQTSYDTFPLETRAWKKAWLPRLAAAGGLLLFDHDPQSFGAVIRADPREEFAVAERFDLTVAG